PAAGTGRPAGPRRPMCSPREVGQERDRGRARPGSDAVQERVGRATTGLDPIREAVAADGSVAGGHIDRLPRPTLNNRGLHGRAFQWAVLELGGDQRCGRILQRRHVVRLLVPPGWFAQRPKGPEPEAIPNCPTQSTTLTGPRTSGRWARGRCWELRRCPVGCPECPALTRNRSTIKS